MCDMTSQYFANIISLRDSTVFFHRHPTEHGQDLQCPPTSSKWIGIIDGPSPIAGPPLSALIVLAALRAAS